jgi:NitT/TauT family transport system substrate-binding protein
MVAIFLLHAGRTPRIRTKVSHRKQARFGAVLKAADICAQDPERVAKFMAAKGYEPRYQLGLSVLKELPYNRWREAKPEDTIRFYSLRLHEAGVIKSGPQKIISDGTDWRFLKELKHELKA